MAKFHQGECVVSYDNTSDVLTDFSGSTKVVSANITRDAGQEATLGADWKDGYLGARMVQGTIEVYVDSDTASGYAALDGRMWDTTAGDELTLQIDRPDSTNGSIRHSGEIQLTGRDETSDRNGGAGATATFNWQSSGTWTRAVISA